MPSIGLASTDIGLVTMNKIDRRGFLKTLATGAALLGAPALALGAARQVVVVGGGTGGVSVARALRRADATIAVTLIEPDSDYYTCYMSNEVLGGGRSLASIRFGYAGLQADGIQVVRDRVSAIDPDARQVITAAGARLPYDRCIVSPGIDFRYETVAGYDASVITTIPHAWKAGEQTRLLRAQLDAMPDGGTFVLAAPPNPYRCPPAPYERASQVAHYFKQYKPRSKVVILDPKSSFAKQSLFIQGWRDLYGYGGGNAMIDWIGGPEQGVVQVDPVSRRVTTGFGDSYNADVLNLVPAQQAGAIAFQAGLTDASGWCPVDPQTFESRLRPGIHVIGDACSASPLPKSGFAANSEAKQCALAVAALLNDRPLANPSYANACYSIVGADYAISVLGVYRLAAGGQQIEQVPGSGGLSRADASAEERRRDVEYAHSWYNNFTRDLFGG